jgi:signal peptidase I
MCELKDMTFEKLFPLAKEVLDSGRSISITVTGNSMYPFLRDSTDSVELSHAKYPDIRFGDVVMYIRDNGKFVVHRVLKTTPTHFHIIGDAQQWVEGPLRPDQLVAKVTAVWRGDKRIECTNFWWRFLSKLWLRMIPVRHIILGIYRRLRRVYSLFQQGGKLHEKKS